MRYLILVSHGEFAPGLHTALTMLVGEREDVIEIAFHDGMSQEDFKAGIGKAVAPITEQDEVLILADLLGGSPLTSVLEYLAGKIGLEKVRAVGGMNLPMAISAVEAEDDPLDAAFAAVQAEAAEQIRPFVPEPAEEDGDI